MIRFIININIKKNGDNELDDEIEVNTEAFYVNNLIVVVEILLMLLLLSKQMKMKIRKKREKFKNNYFRSSRSSFLFHLKGKQEKYNLVLLLLKN